LRIDFERKFNKLEGTKEKTMKDQDMRTRMDMRGRDEIGCWNRNRQSKAFRKLLKGMWSPKGAPDNSRKVGK
jgi:hypothetical protein